MNGEFCDKCRPFVAAREAQAAAKALREAVEKDAITIPDVLGYNVPAVAVEDLLNRADRIERIAEGIAVQDAPEAARRDSVAVERADAEWMLDYAAYAGMPEDMEARLRAALERGGS